MLYFTLVIIALVPPPFSHLSTQVHQELVVASTQAACLQYAGTLVPRLRAQHGMQFIYVPRCTELPKA